MSEKHDGWTVKRYDGRLLPWWMDASKTRVLNRIGRNVYKEWKKMGTTIVKVKLVEVK